MPKGFRGRSPSNVLNFLQGLNFPCDKAELVHYAEDKEAPDEVIVLLDNLPDQEFDNMSDVISAIGQVE
jgi:hypothetical protein